MALRHLPFPSLENRSWAKQHCDGLSGRIPITACSTPCSSRRVLPDGAARRSRGILRPTSSSIHILLGFGPAAGPRSNNRRHLPGNAPTHLRGGQLRDMPQDERP